MSQPSDPREAARAQAGGSDPLAGSAPAAAGDEKNRPAAPAPRRGGVSGALLRFWRASAVPVLSIVFALFVAGLLILVSAPLAGEPFDPWLPFAAYRALLEGAFGRPEQWADGNFNGLTTPPCKRRR